MEGGGDAQLSYLLPPPWFCGFGEAPRVEDAAEQQFFSLQTLLGELMHENITLGQHRSFSPFF